MKRCARYLDLAAVKQIITIAGILRALGHDPGRRDRAACPIHGGANPQSFKFTTNSFVCFACGAQGDGIALAQAVLKLSFRDALTYCARLGGIDPRRPRRATIRRAVRERERAMAAVAQWRAARQAAWSAAVDAHYEASADCRFLEGLWERDRECRDPLTFRVLELLSAAYLNLDVAEWRVEETWQSLNQKERTA